MFFTKDENFAFPISVISLYTVTHILTTHYKTRVKPPEHITIPTNIIIHKQILAQRKHRTT